MVSGEWSRTTRTEAMLYLYCMFVVSMLVYVVLVNTPTGNMILRSFVWTHVECYRCRVFHPKNKQVSNRPVCNGCYTLHRFRMKRHGHGGYQGHIRVKGLDGYAW